MCQGGPGVDGAAIAAAGAALKRDGDIACDLSEGLPAGALDGVDVVIHMAGQGNPDADFQDVNKNNIVGTQKVFDAAASSARCRRVIFGQSKVAAAAAAAATSSNHAIAVTIITTANIITVTVAVTW